MTAEALSRRASTWENAACDRWKFPPLFDLLGLAGAREIWALTEQRPPRILRGALAPHPVGKILEGRPPCRPTSAELRPNALLARGKYRRRRLPVRNAYASERVAPSNLPIQFVHFSLIRPIA